MNTKAFDRRDQLITAALDEFIDNNYEHASLNTIIKNANLSKGVFYYHFKNKEALYIAVLEDATHKKWQYIKEHSSQTNNKGLNIFDQFLHQTEISIAFANEYPKYHLLGNLFLKEKGTPIYTKAVKFTMQLLTHLFREFDTIFTFQDSDDLQKKKEVLQHYYAFMRHGLNP